LALVAVAAIASRSWHAGLEEDIGIAVVRSLIQLTAIGYVITLIFDEDSFLLVLVLLASSAPSPLAGAPRVYRTPSGPCSGHSRSPRRRPSGSWWRSASSTPRRATWCPSAGW
jgi:Uncharacterised protein family (UPF0014)